MNAPLRCAYVPAEDGAQIHVRLGGAGPAVLLIPESPGSGAAVTRLARELIDAGHAVAVPDLIGAGATTYPDDLAADLDAQARLAATVLDGLGWPGSVLVGDGAGTAVALRLAAARPDLVRGLAILAAPYGGPAATPAWDSSPAPHGEHLVRLWHALRDQHIFTPYWLPAAAHRRHRPMPDPIVLHEVFADTLAHAAVFGRLAEAVRRAWPALVDAAKVSIVEVEAPGDAGAVLAALSKLPPPRTHDPGDRPAAGGPRAYVDIHNGQLHVRLGASASARKGTFHTDSDHKGALPRAERGLPVLLLHANPGSGEGLEPLLRSIARDRPAIAIDLPGHGRSDPLPTAAALGATLAGTYAPVLLEAMDALDLDRVDVYGTHTGAGLAVELAIAAPGRVRSLVLDGVPLFDDDPALVTAVLAQYFPDLTPDRHGSHLVRAWNMTRDMALWWPWFQQDVDGIRDGEPYPEATVERVNADMLHSLPAYDTSYRAAWTWQGTQRLPLVTQPVLVGSSPADPLRAMTSRALALLNDGHETTFPPSGPQRPDTLARSIAAFEAGLGHDD